MGQPELRVTAAGAGDGTGGSGGQWWQEKVSRWDPRWWLHFYHSLFKI